MGAVNTNSISLAVAEETALSVTAPTAPAEYLEPNEISDYGFSLSTVVRAPISKDRQNKKGTITDVESSVSISGDTTASFLLAFLEGAMFSTFHKRGFWRTGEVEAKKTTGFTVTTAMPGALMEGMIIYCKGWVNKENNGLHIVDAGSTTTNIKTTDIANLVDEVPPEGSCVFVVGFQGEAGDIQIDANGNLEATTLDWNTLGLEVGSGMFIGGLAPDTHFDSTENTGLVRVREIKGQTLIVDKRQQAFVADTGATKTIQLFSGWFIRNVPVDDPLFKERSYSFELTYPGLSATNADEYEYSIGNLINTFELSMPLSDKSTMSINTYGTDVENITDTRKGWVIKPPLFTEAFSTPNDFLRLRLQKVDETGITSFFKEATLSLNNNVGGERVIGKIGSAFINYGNFEVGLSTSVVFTDKELIRMMRNNCTVTCDFCIENSDAGFLFDIPSMTMGDGTRDFPINEKVKVSLSSSAFGDAIFGYSLGVTFFPYLPSDRVDAC